MACQISDSLAWMSQSFRWPDLAEAMAARGEKRPPGFPPLAGSEQGQSR